MKKLKFKTWIVFSVLFIFYTLELIAYNLNGKQFPLSVLPNIKFVKTKDRIADLYSFNQLYKKDPLLGWTIDFDKMGEHFSHKHNCILFENISDLNQDTFKIFISGGSTSDLIF